MGKIVLDRSGDLRKGVFYRFDVLFDDEVLVGSPDPDWIVVPRTPTNAALLDADKPSYLYLEDEPREEDRVKTNDCPADPTHVTRTYYKALTGGTLGGPRLSTFLPTLSGMFCGVTDQMRGRLDSLKIKGKRFDLIKLYENSVKVEDLNVWIFQFTGNCRLRLPTFVDAENRCPHCGVTEIMCTSCGDWMPYCKRCNKYMIRLNDEKDDGRMIVIEEDPWRVIEGKTWDGSDLIQAGGRNFASKRFIDWLFRIDAAPFYAEPVWFCVDGMSDQQKKWFEELQKPLEA